ncbi:MAG: DNA glycosylase AlkZ-like family protein [Candidatus Limnocylindria bacterium]
MRDELAEVPCGRGRRRVREPCVPAADRGGSLPVVLIDGRIGAAWRIERKHDHAVVRVGPFGGLARSARTALAEEVEGLGALVGTPTRLELVA